MSYQKTDCKDLVKFWSILRENLRKQVNFLKNHEFPVYRNISPDFPDVVVGRSPPP